MSKRVHESSAQHLSHIFILAPIPHHWKFHLTRSNPAFFRHGRHLVLVVPRKGQNPIGVVLCRAADPVLQDNGRGGAILEQKCIALTGSKSGVRRER
ncbi:hypothetical protein TIFTF001_056369 [Ficus carica]|uniref:Uncharacterized protein n=1 Tax=Ficus carica TaxID=3494 RepID=A0AA88EIT4_FICCA|nr:hypothetical protein TIFTF001_056369 [Ficus carica]